MIEISLRGSHVGDRRDELQTAAAFRALRHGYRDDAVEERDPGETVARPLLLALLVRSPPAWHPRVMTKSDLIAAIAERTNITRSRAEEAVNCVFDAMTDALKHDEGIEIRGFGSFSVRRYEPYEGRNPRTGESVHVSAKRLPFFKVGKELRERVNGQGSLIRANTDV